MVYRVAADIGGTFTDIVIENTSDKVFSTIKVLSTPQNQAIAVLEGLKKNISNIDEIDFIVHGTTVGLNAFLERKGSRVLLVMTAGISDTYTIARGDRKELYNVQYTKPEVLVPRKDVVEVRERMKWNGDILTNINKEDIITIIKKINDEDIKAVAICFLHSYVNPEHELKALELIREKVRSDVVISLSHTLAREWREYERGSTAIMNSYIGPVTNNYLKSLESNLLKEGYKHPLYIMQSNGGVIRAKTAIEQPVKTLLSGPVGGTIGGVTLSKITGRKNLICVDMGGTSFDMSLIVNGEPFITNETELEHLPLLIPLVDIHTIGAGGGSIAWLEAGALRVGPQSAGAEPGPACYDRGGQQPTVTDANFFLGRIGTESKLGGWMKLNYDASNEVLKNLAEKLSISELELAEGILSIINAKMADAIRTITVKQGIDPREFTLVAFGGAAPMHGVWLAEELEINETIVPNDPGTFSAWGMLQTDIRKDVTVNFFHAFSNLNENKIINSFEKLTNEATDLLSQENVKESDMSFNLTADMRYIGQEYYVNVQINKPIKLEEINKCFHETYEKQYGHSTPDGPIEFINLRLVATGHIPKTSEFVKKFHQSAEINENNRSVFFDNNKYDTEVLNRANIKSDKSVEGPVIIEEETATTVVPPKYYLKKDNFGNLIITKKQ
ncbi:MAG: hydantoinase/oxoprolinase family protein [Alphaproteobacteria bacterium]|jgi:N-methylhydantoinase A|nr:hydantoinase/oxoprolinase family protein [Alphaproteobacteria bacterium]